MGAPATHRHLPADGQAPADVLGSPDEDDGDRRAARRRPALAAAAVLAAVVVGATAVGPTSQDDEPLLVMRAGELVPRDHVDGRRAEAGMHVEVVNTSRQTLDLQRAALVPGAWQVDIVDRTRLVPGESAVLSLHRTVDCDGGTSYGPAPRHLLVEARTADDAAVVVRLPVDDPSAYRGQLDDALHDPGRACVVTGGDVSGPLGDLVSSWRARRAWPPAPRPD